jgi:hypothetical protein
VIVTHAGAAILAAMARGAFRFPSDARAIEMLSYLDAALRLMDRAEGAWR